MKRLVFLLLALALLAGVFMLVGIASAQEPMPVPSSGGVPRQHGDGAFLNDTERMEPGPTDDTVYLYYRECHMVTRPDGSMEAECYWVKVPANDYYCALKPAWCPDE